MSLKKWSIAFFSVLILSLTTGGQASAHRTITSGPYNIEIGWLKEPPITGQMNAILLNLSPSDPAASTALPDDISHLTLTVSFGVQSRALALLPLWDNTPGEYMAPILPTIPGLYTVKVSGTLGVTAIEFEVQPEEVRQAEVQAGEAVGFPLLRATPGGRTLDGTEGMCMIALVVALGALGFSLFVFRKRA